MSKFKEAKINEIIKEDSPSLYVVNNTGNSGSSESGSILLTVVPGANEQAIPVVVPKTWAPFDMASQIAKEFLVNNSSFRKAVSQRVIVLVKAEDAEHYLKTVEGASSENSRAMQSLYGISQKIEELRAPDPVVNRDVERLKNANDQFTATQVDVDPEIAGKEIDMKLIEIVARHRDDNDVTESDMYSVVRSIFHDKPRGFSGDEKEYVANNVKFEKVLKFVNDQN